MLFVAVGAQGFVFVNENGKTPLYGTMSAEFMFGKLNAEDKREELTDGVTKFMGWQTRNDARIVDSMLSGQNGVLKCCDKGLTPTLYHDQCVVCGSAFWAEDILIYCPSHGNLHVKCAVLRPKA